jgi:hypothetical protein
MRLPSSPFGIVSQPNSQQQVSSSTQSTSRLIARKPITSDLVTFSLHHQNQPRFGAPLNDREKQNLKIVASQSFDSAQQLSKFLQEEQPDKSGKTRKVYELYDLHRLPDTKELASALKSQSGHLKNLPPDERLKTISAYMAARTGNKTMRDTESVPYGSEGHSGSSIRGFIQKNPQNKEVLEAFRQNPNTKVGKGR